MSLCALLPSLDFLFGSPAAAYPAAYGQISQAFPQPPPMIPQQQREGESPPLLLTHSLKRLLPWASGLPRPLTGPWLAVNTEVDGRATGLEEVLS